MDGSLWLSQWSDSLAQICPPDAVICQQIFGRTAHDDPARLQDVGPIGNLQRACGILLYQ
jgi:hypothetical protein